MEQPQWQVAGFGEDAPKSGWTVTYDDGEQVTSDQMWLSRVNRKPRTPDEVHEWAMKFAYGRTISLIESGIAKKKISSPKKDPFQGL